MLAFTNLLKEITRCLYLVNALNFPPLAYPFKIKIESKIYHLSVSSVFLKRNWKVHFLILELCILLLLARFHFDRKSVFDTCVFVSLNLLTILLQLSIIFHFLKAHDFAYLINQFCDFENRFVFADSRVPQTKFNRSILIRFVCRWFSVAFFTYPFLYATACALFPRQPWNYLPSLVYGKCSFSTDCLVQKLATYFYAYVSMRVFTNYALINVLFNLLIPTYCLCNSLDLLIRLVYECYFFKLKILLL